MSESEREKLEKIKIFLTQDGEVNLDNLSWILNKFQERLIDLENKVFLNKDE
jgi:hypothetical protein